MDRFEALLLAGCLALLAAFAKYAPPLDHPQRAASLVEVHGE